MSNSETASLLQKFYNLPIYRKTGLIPWFSLGALTLIVGVGGLILNKNIQDRWFVESESQLGIIETLIGDLSSNNELSEVAETIAAFNTQSRYSSIFIRRNNGELTLLSAANNSDKKLLTDTSAIELAWQSDGVVSDIANIGGEKYALAAQKILGKDNKAVGVMVYGQTINSATTILISSILAQIVLATIVLIFMVALTKILSKAVAEPLQKLQQITQDFAEGNTKARAEVRTTDEVGLLASTFNFLADSIEIKEQQLKEEAKRSSFLKEVAFNIGRASELAEILQIVVDDSRIALNADRIIYYAFDDSWQGNIVAESLVEGFPVALGAEINDPCFAEECAEQYQQGKVKAIANIYNADLNDCHLKMLEPLAVKASLITPVIVKEKLVGLLIAHQCDKPRNWQEAEIDLLLQIGAQLGTALEKIELLEQQKVIEQQERQARENLQRRALELLMEVDPVSRGDLTVRVKVQEDEIGTIADSYNSTIESLRKLVAQVQTASSLVSMTTSEKEISIQELSNNASEQTEEIGTALARIQGITESIKAVASNAEAAETAVQQAAETVKAGDDAMNRTVEGFQGIRTTVAETAKKVKRLGESSQKISKVVNVISNFADQTNLLALNASIEAAHAGEEGRGFAVVADEVRSLARQSAEATAEIEALVAEIQAETNEVVAAMESGTEQVVAGTKLVDETRYSLIQIADASSQIDRLVNEIAQAAMEQSKDSEVVSNTMVQIAAISDKTATEASEVSESFKDLLSVAQQLQDSVAKFKVN